MYGMTYVDGVPHVWGAPAKWDAEEPLLDCFGHWRCPCCNAPMTAGDRPICLNACHLSDEARERFSASMRLAAETVEQVSDGTPPGQ